VFGCGQDSEKRYAGLEVAQVSPAGAPGYRLRYLDPPWELVDDDPLATGKLSEVPFGASTNCGASSAECLAVEPKSSTVLEIDRPSPVAPDEDVITYPKYRAEASVVRCPPGSLASTDLCADSLAEADAAGRATEEGGDDVFAAPEDGENDFGQHFRELNAKNRDSLRYRRIVYFATEDREIAVRLFLEANPSLKEKEVTRMIHAFEVVEQKEQP
jgi:hypothetical protein